MKTVLFVAYGSGHIKMVVPLAQALAANGMAKPVVLALTTAAPVARAAGLEVLQFRDFVTEADGAALALALAGFNLGVETGQMAIVAAVLPLAFALRQTWLYRKLALPVGSVAVALLALVWCLERGLNIRLLTPAGSS